MSGLRSDRLHDPGEVAAGHSLSRASQARLEPGDVRDPLNQMPIVARDGCRLDANESVLGLNGW